MINKHKPMFRLLNDIDRQKLVKTIIDQLDSDHWKLELEKNGVTVFSSDKLNCPFIGFKTVTCHTAERKIMISFLGKNILKAMERMNHRYIDGEIVRKIDETDVRISYIVRTAFTMPLFIKNREFMHLLHVEEVDKDTSIIAYHSVDDDFLPSPYSGFIRCPIYPSGQRITALGKGKVRVEHMMVYDLAGNISPWVQNKLFFPGHVRAYLREWQALIDIFNKERDL
ncbi:START domain-containing protein [Spirochaetota bacterium]